MSNPTGENIYGWIRDLMPLPRSITGDGLRQTLLYLKNILPQLTIHEVPSNTKAFDWVVPDEWSVREAYIADETGHRIIDYANHNLHLVGYSEPIDDWFTLEELEEHLYSLPDKPDAIPYVTSYYQRGWGFCLTHGQRQQLRPGKYHVHIDSNLTAGALTYGEVMLPGMLPLEVMLSTYVCHPMMANNELSGPTVVTALGAWLSSLPQRKYTYRLVFVPETIGSIVYLSRNLDIMKANTIAGFQVTCVGDDRAYSYLESRLGNTYADRVLRHILDHTVSHYDKYDFTLRGSDERQYCSPGVDLPVATFCRSKFGTYPEYHTSLDNLDVVSPTGLQGAFDVLRNCIRAIEHNEKFMAQIPCEPRFGMRGLYPNVDTVGSGVDIKPLRDLYAFSDGNHDLLDIAVRTKRPISDYFEVAENLLRAGLIKRA